MIYLYATLLTLLNLAFWSSILFGMPGIWLMVLAAVIVEWLQPEVSMFSQATLYVSAGLALLAEILEFLMGAAGARQAGGSRRGAALAIVGGVVGAILGGAAIGRFWGTTSKMIIGAVVLVLLTVAAFFPD
jgi:uncharacterized protein YqgC (DUF456 family)